MTRAEAKRRACAEAADVLAQHDSQWSTTDRDVRGYLLDDSDLGRLCAAWNALVEELRRRGERREKGARK